MAIDFDSLIPENINSIRNIARSYTNLRDSEDLMQEILIQLWRSHGHFRGDSRPETWLYRIAINTAITFQRQEIRNRKGQEKNRSLRTDGTFSAGLSQDEILEAFVGDLNDVDRAVLTMYLDGLTAVEMESVLGVTANAISVRVSRLKGKFEKQFVD